MPAVLMSRRRRSNVYVARGTTVPSIVIFGAADGIAQNLVSFVNVLKLQGCARGVVAIGMIAPGESPESCIYLGRIGCGGDFEYSVIIELGPDDWWHEVCLSYRIGA
jgi:hypothetical protein